MLERVRQTEPATYLRVAAVLVPKEMNIAVEQKAPGNLDKVRELLDILDAAGVESADELRARLARPVK